MIFDTSSDKIILITYPSGGFGHFIYHVLSEFTMETVSIISDNKFAHSPLGNSHECIRYTTMYSNCDNDDNYVYLPEITINPHDKIILVLCDNGVDHDDNDTMVKVFPNAKIVRMVIDNIIPVIYHRNRIVNASEMAALGFDTDTRIKLYWDEFTNEYAVREYHTLSYHSWARTWQPLDSTTNVSIEGLMLNPYMTIVDLVKSLKLTIRNPELLQNAVNQWHNANCSYFSVYHNTKMVLASLNDNIVVDLSHITDLHEQGYINFRLEKKYNIIIPVYDYKDWFKTTNDMQEMIIECLK